MTIRIGEIIMKVDVKNEVLKELEELYNTPRIKSFTFEVRVSEDSIPIVYYSVEKNININN